MINTASELHNNLLNIYKTQYDNFSKTHKKKINVVNKSKNFTLELYLDEDENEMPPLEDDEEVKSEP